MDRLNQLKAFMQFYQDNIGPKENSGPFRSALGGVGSGFNAVGYNVPQMAANWANDQVTLDNQNRQRQMAPNFFGGQTQFAQPQYVQPQAQNAENPYFKRAFELNNDPMSWQKNGNALSAILGR